MNLITPSLFYLGPLLVALPIVLHLIMRQRPKPFEFPALRFIQKQHSSNRRRLRLRHFLLLALRAMAILFLAGALARPSMQLGGGVGGQEMPVATVLVFDAAPRMEYRQNNQTRIEAAKELGQWLLAQLPDQSQIAVLDTQRGSGAFQVDRDAARARIERLATVPDSDSLPSRIEEALRLVGESELARKEIYVFTDLSEAAWPAEEASRVQQRLTETPNVEIHIIDVGVERPVNVGLETLRLSDQTLSSSGELRIDTNLTCRGPGGERTIALYLLGKGQSNAERPREMKGQQSVELAEGESRAISFTIGQLGIGTHQGLVEIVGQDGLDADDVRYFTIEVKPPWPVLVAASKPAHENALYLTQALAPITYRQQGKAQFECKVVEWNDLVRVISGDEAVSAEEGLAKYSAVFLLDPTPLSPAVWQKLADFVSDGGGVGLFLGRNANTNIDSFSEPIAQALLPAELVRQARAPDGDVFLAPRDYEHPILAPLRGIAGSIPWREFPVFRYWQLGDTAKGVDVVMRYVDGRPALLERGFGNGRALTMTTPVSADPGHGRWNLLPIGDAWPFMILMQRMAMYLVGGGGEQFNYLAGQTVVMPIDSARRFGVYQLFSPGGLVFPISAGQDEDSLLITATNEVGNHRVRAGGPTDVALGFSINLAPEQTQMRRTSHAALEELFGSTGCRFARTRGEIERSVSVGRVGQELFPWLIVFVAVVLGMEGIVANRFYPEK